VKQTFDVQVQIDNASAEYLDVSLQDSKGGFVALPTQNGLQAGKTYDLGNITAQNNSCIGSLTAKVTDFDGEVRTHTIRVQIQAGGPRENGVGNARAGKGVVKKQLA
jgi:hypothetical protein